MNTSMVHGKVCFYLLEGVLMIGLFLSTVTVSAYSDSVKPNGKVNSYLNVRGMPDVKGRKVGVLRPSQTLEYIDSVSNWHRVRLADGGIGYVSQEWSVLVSETGAALTKADKVVGSWNFK